MIVLLDLNYTLVENSTVKLKPFATQIAHECYRQWLVELLRGYHTILVTARPAIYEQPTLQSILRKTGWQPQEAYFNTHGLMPPRAKERMLKENIFKQHGRNARYLAIESNPATRGMYARYGIPAVKVQEGEQWKELPIV